MKQLRHTPLYVPANLMGEAAGHGKAFFYRFRRVVVCLLALAVLLACAGVVYAEDPDQDTVEWIDIQDVLEGQADDPDPEFDPADQEDPSDPDYGGAAEIDPGYVPDAEYGVQPYSSSTPWYWSSTDISKVTSVMDILYGGTNNAGSLLRMSSKLDAIATNTSKASIDYTSKFDSLIANTGSNGAIANRLSLIFDRLGLVYEETISVNQKLGTLNSLLTSGSVRTLSNGFSSISDPNIVFSSLLPINTSVSPGDSVGSYSYFYSVRNGVEAYFSSSVTSSGNVLWRSNSLASYTFFQFGRTSQPVFLTPGSYSLYFLVIGDNVSLADGDVILRTDFTTSSFRFPGLSSVISRPSGSSSAVFFGSFDISSPVAFWSLSASFPTLTVSNAYYYVFLYRNSDVAYTDKVMQDSVNQGQAEATDQLQQSVDQTEAFEQQMFQDVSTYTSQLDFGLGDWVEAAAGISYIGSVFMLIWDNAPVQPIILSLMLGLCMLLLGRGARVADAMSQSTSEESSLIRQGKGRGS